MTSADVARDSALAWLTGRLRWERLLDDLHRRADGLDVEAPSETATATELELEVPAAKAA